MISEANIPNLLRCVRNTEKARGFWFPMHFHDCGSYGCLIGNDAIAHLGLEGSWYQVIKQLENQTGCNNAARWSSQEYGFPLLGNRVFDWLFYMGNGRGDTKEQRLARLRKFIYYVLHKRELLYDDSGRIRETARRSEGDHHVLRAVKSAVERKEREPVPA